MSLTEFGNLGFFPYNGGSSTVYIDSTNDYLYIPRLQGTNITIHRSTDGGSNWTERSTGKPSGLTNSGTWIDCYQVGDVLHIVTTDSDGAGATRVEYHTYNMATDAWGTTNSLVSSNDSTNGYANAIAVRSSGDVVVAYQGDTYRAKGTDYLRVEVRENTGGGWGSAMVIGGTANNHYYVDCGSVVDSSGRVWFQYTNSASAGAQYQTYLADGSSSLSTPGGSPAFTSNYRPASGWGGGFTGRAVLLFGTDNKLFHAYLSTSADSRFNLCTGTGSAFNGVEDPTPTAAAQQSDAFRGGSFLDHNSNVAYVFQSTDQDVHHASRVATVWDDPNTDHGNTTTGGIIFRMRGDLLTDTSGNKRLGYVIYDSDAGFFEYCEWLLATGGTTTPQSVAGTLPLSGAFSALPKKAVAGSLGASGTILRAVSVSSLISSLPLAGSVAKKIQTAFSGTLNLSGILTSIKLFFQALTATLGLAGGLSKKTATSKTASLAPVGDTVKSTKTSKAGTLPFSGSLNSMTIRSLLASLGLSGTLSGKVVIQQILTATLGLAGDLAKLPRKALDGSLPLAGTITAKIYIFLEGVLNVSGDFLGKVKKVLAGVLDLAGNLSGIAVIQRFLAGTLGLAGTFTKQAQTEKTGTLGVGGSLFKKTSKNASGTLSFAGTFFKKIGKSFSALLDFLGDLVTGGPGVIPQEVEGTLSFAGNLTKSGPSWPVDFEVVAENNIFEPSETSYAFEVEKDSNTFEVY